MESTMIDQLFEEKFLNQTKQLSTGQTIKILSRKCRRNQTNFVYSCHLCGFIDLGDEQALHLHVTDKMHRELLKLPKLPFRNWMKEVVVQEEKHEKPCTLGCGSDCSDLKAMVDNMCGLKKEPNTEQMPRNLKRASTSKSSGSSKLKHRRSRSPKARESRSRSRKAAKRRHRSRCKSSQRTSSSSSDGCNKSSSKNENQSPRYHRIKYSKTSDIAKKNIKHNFDDPPPSFLTICRFLVTLEQHISKYSNDISRLFSLSLTYERKKIGSSNELLTADNLKFLAELQTQLKNQIVLGILPQQMHRIAKSFVNDLDRLVEKNAENKKKMLIDIEMPQI